jgi:hypothetical protein
MPATMQAGYRKAAVRSVDRATIPTVATMPTHAEITAEERGEATPASSA